MRRYSVKEIAKLEKRHFRDEEGVFVIEGKKVFGEAVQAKAEITQVFVTEKFAREQRDFLAQIDPRMLTVISEHNFQRLASTETPSGLLAVVKKTTVTFDEILKNNRVVVFENLRDPGNLGTMIRTADWFGIRAIIISKEGTDIYNDKVIRATMGSLFHVEVYVAEDLGADLQKLKTAGFPLIVTRPEVESTLPQSLPEKMAIIIGNESLGTSPESDVLADYTYAIPRHGQAESLNAAVSFGIVLYELSR